MRKTLGIIGAVITCPCHVPIWLGLLGGTVIGVELSQNLVPVLAVATTLFLAFLALALVEGSRNQHTARKNAASFFLQNRDRSDQRNE